MTMGSWFLRVRRLVVRGAGQERKVDCTEVRVRGSDLIDEDCPEPLGARIRTHLGLCTDCDSWFRSLALTVGLLREIPEQKVPESTLEKVRQATHGNR